MSKYGEYPETQSFEQPRPKISYIIASRNDGFCGDPIERLWKTQAAIHNCHNDDNAYEIVVVDWGSEEPIGLLTGVQVKEEQYIYVPPSLATPHFHETRALNLGIRRARGEWVARLDQDTLVGPRFVEWFRRMSTEADETNYITGVTSYFSLRRDLPEDLVWRDWHRCTEPFWRGAVGILLAPAGGWKEVRGYYEGLDQRNHIEHDLCLRLKKYTGLRYGLVDLGEITNYDFHHQHHPRCTDRPDNPYRSEQVLEQMISEGKFTNDENWGMKEYWDQIEESVL